MLNLISHRRIPARINLVRLGSNPSTPGGDYSGEYLIAVTQEMLDTVDGTTDGWLNSLVDLDIDSETHWTVLSPYDAGGYTFDLSGVAAPTSVSALAQQCLQENGNDIQL